MARSEKQFTKVYFQTLDALCVAGATRTQERAYIVLSRFHGKGGAGPCECWTVAKDAARVVHMTPHNFSTALRGLTEKTFKDSRGREVPVLVRMRGGYNNAPTVYFDNIFADIKGVETLTPKEVTPQTPLTDVENHEGVEPEPRRGWAGTTKGLGVQPPIEIEEKKRSSLGGALRPAHSAARRRTPTPQEETGKVDVLVSKGDPAEEPGPDEAKALRELWESYKALGELTQEQKALKERFERSETWREICRH